MAVKFKQTKKICIFLLIVLPIFAFLTAGKTIKKILGKTAQAVCWIPPVGTPGYGDGMPTGECSSTDCPSDCASPCSACGGDE